MHVHVVGGSGFIGTRLCRRLAVNSTCTFDIFDKVQSNEFASATIVGDVRSRESLVSFFRPGAVVVNLAAEHRDDVRPRHLYDDVNVTGARNVASAASQCHVDRVIFTSSVAVYGFAPAGTDEGGSIAPFNDYGRTKHQAEQVLREWQSTDAQTRSLTILRPTVVFGEGNRGNVYNLLRQLSGDRFVMVGSGTNQKSMVYVENIAAIIEHFLASPPGAYIYNVVDKPDFTMEALVDRVRTLLGKTQRHPLRIPVAAGYAIGKGFDVVAAVTGRTFPISAIRVKKFCSDSVFSSKIGETGFAPPVSLEEGLARTVRYEFIESHAGDEVFYSE